MAGQVDLTTRVRSEDLVTTDLEREVLEQMRVLCGGADTAMERHGLRCFLIGDQIARVRGAEIDREGYLIASLVHDIGLYDGASEGGVYVTDGRNWAEGLIRGNEGWDDARIETCLNAIERHHELRPQWDAGVEVEALRRADLVELSKGLINFGLDRGWLGSVWASVPREGTYREIGKQVIKAFRERPATVPRILIRGKG